MERRTSAQQCQLFSTSACHLCDIAEGLLLEAGVMFEKVDISDSDELFERYGVLIPVLRRPDGKELNWPFSPGQLRAFMSSWPPP